MFHQNRRNIILFSTFKSSVELFVGFNDDFETSWEEGVDLIHVE